MMIVRLLIKWIQVGGLLFSQGFSFVLFSLFIIFVFLITLPV